MCRMVVVLVFLSFNLVASITVQFARCHCNTNSDNPSKACINGKCEYGNACRITYQHKNGIFTNLSDCVYQGYKEIGGCLASGNDKLCECYKHFCNTEELLNNRFSKGQFADLNVDPDALTPKNLTTNSLSVMSTTPLGPVNATKHSNAMHISSLLIWPSLVLLADLIQ